MRGFRPVRMINGGDFLGHLKRYSIAASYTTAIYCGDPVALSSGTIVRGTAGSPILGVLVGVDYIDPTGKQKFSHWWPGTASCTAIRAQVVDDPDVLFEGYTASGVGNIAQSYLGASVNFALGTGNATTGQSGAEFGASGGKNFLIHSFVDAPGNDLGVPARKVLGTIIQHQRRPYELST